MILNSVNPVVCTSKCATCIHDQMDKSQSMEKDGTSNSEIQQLINTLLPCIPCNSHEDSTNIHLGCFLQYLTQPTTTARCLSCGGDLHPINSKVEILCFAHLGLRAGETRSSRFTRIESLLPGISQQEVEGDQPTDDDFLPTKAKCMKIFQDRIQSNPVLVARFYKEYASVDNTLFPLRVVEPSTPCMIPAPPPTAIPMHLQQFALSPTYPQPLASTPMHDQPQNPTYIYITVNFNIPPPPPQDDLDELLGRMANIEQLLMVLIAGSSLAPR